MRDEPSRLMAFLAVVLALLNAGYHFHGGNLTATIYFMVGAILLTLVTGMSVRRQVI